MQLGFSSICLRRPALWTIAWKTGGSALAHDIAVRGQCSRRRPFMLGAFFDVAACQLRANKRQCEAFTRHNNRTDIGATATPRKGDSTCARRFPKVLLSLIHISEP